jgi:ATP-dependent protease ClpP protease subunit
MAKLKRKLNEIYVDHTGKTYDQIEAALDRDTFMSPQEAVDFGMIFSAPLLPSCIVLSSHSVL